MVSLHSLVTATTEVLLLSGDLSFVFVTGMSWGQNSGKLE